MGKQNDHEKFLRTPSRKTDYKSLARVPNIDEFSAYGSSTPKISQTLNDILSHPQGVSGAEITYGEEFNFTKAKKEEHPFFQCCLSAIRQKPLSFDGVIDQEIGFERSVRYTVALAKLTREERKKGSKPLRVVEVTIKEPRIKWENCERKDVKTKALLFSSGNIIIDPEKFPEDYEDYMGGVAIYGLFGEAYYALELLTSDSKPLKIAEHTFSSGCDF